MDLSGYSEERKRKLGANFLPEPRELRSSNNSDGGDSISSSIGRGARGAFDAVSGAAKKFSAATQNNNPHVDIYAPGSPTAIAQQRQGDMAGKAGAAVAGSVADAAALIPRAALRVSDNISRGFTGQAPNNEPFTTTPVTEKLLDVASRPMFTREQDVSSTPQAIKGFPTTRPERMNDSTTAISRVGGNVPLPAGYTGAGLTPNLSANDMQLKRNMGEIDRLLAAGETTKYTPEQIQTLREQAGFLRGGTDRRAVGPDGLPIRSGNSNYSFQGSPEAAERFNSAVAPGEYSTQAQTSRGMQREQFLTRQGIEKVDPETGLKPSQLLGMSPEKRFGLKQAVEDMKIKRDIAEGIGAERLAQAEERQANAGLRNRAIAKQDEIDGLMNEYEKATPDRKSQIDRRLTRLGAIQPKEPKEQKVYFRKQSDLKSGIETEEPFVLDENGQGRAIKVNGGGDTMDFGNGDDQATVSYLQNLKASNPKEYERIKKEFMSMK